MFQLMTQRPTTISTIELTSFDYYLILLLLATEVIKIPQSSSIIATDGWRRRSQLFPTSAIIFTASKSSRKFHSLIAKNPIIRNASIQDHQEENVGLDSGLSVSPVTGPQISNPQQISRLCSVALNSLSRPAFSLARSPLCLLSLPGPAFSLARSPLCLLSRPAFSLARSPLCLLSRPVTALPSLSPGLLSRPVTALPSLSPGLLSRPVTALPSLSPGHRSAFSLARRPSLCPLRRFEKVRSISL
ncbi:hypothetical protein Scep_007534 [Stephania cephalantha]|uniref:Uncharacterized protein n=1 Tax=Stephania cephalantha TaxID=152367 RepID=A0AAP0PLW6_9MAGN